jgi:hypothetical protein
MNKKDFDLVVSAIHDDLVVSAIQDEKEGFRVTRIASAKFHESCVFEETIRVTRNP